jgi:hypothetical protein
MTPKGCFKTTLEIGSSYEHSFETNAVPSGHSYKKGVSTHLQTNSLTENTFNENTEKIIVIFNNLIGLNQLA